MRVTEVDNRKTAMGILQWRDPFGTKRLCERVYLCMSGLSSEIPLFGYQSLSHAILALAPRVIVISAFSTSVVLAAAAVDMATQHTLNAVVAGSVVATLTAGVCAIVSGRMLGIAIQA